MWRGAVAPRYNRALCSTTCSRPCTCYVPAPALLVVLLQQGKGGDMASAFGGGGSQTAFGARAGATILTKATTVLGVLFMLGAIALGIIGQRGPDSLMGGVRSGAGSAPAAPAPAQRRSSRHPRRHRAGESARQAVASGFSRSTSSVRLRAGPLPRESGGTGRRTSLRGWRSQERGGSNPPFRTNTLQTI